MIIIILCCCHTIVSSQETPDYFTYHLEIASAEELVSQEQYGEALLVYHQVFDSYEFIFLKDYQVACQVAFLAGNIKESFEMLRSGISGGWELRLIRKNKFLKGLKNYPEWKHIREQYDSLHSIFQNHIDPDVREKVKKMFKRDQWKALGALLKLSDKAQIRYGERKFAPHSEQQLQELDAIMKEHGYPGERLIGNELWMNVILSHHNSISQEYNKKDTLYSYFKPRLLEAVETGHMSPYSYAIIEDWYVAVQSGHRESTYGFVGEIHDDKERMKADQMRMDLGLRSIETRNRLLEIQDNTGMYLNLTGMP